MIYEFRTYDLKPRTLGQYDATLKKSLSAGRLEHSRLFGYWYSAVSYTHLTLPTKRIV